MSDQRHDDAAADLRAVYIHIPFCRRRCPYCDFAVVDMAQQAPDIDRYVAAVLAEIGMEPEWAPIDAVNLGGGTPSALAPSQLAVLVDAIGDRFGLAVDAEVSIEANPEDWDPEYAEAVRGAGFNRVSLGVQSFDDEVLADLGRSHTPDDAVAAIGTAVAAGFDTVNVDLIFGTPGESLDSWKQTANTALALEINHLSAYALTIELGTKLSKQVRAGAAAPDPDDQADKYELLSQAVADRLDHYEVSNWAATAKECRYNQTTWAQGEYAGFGLGAHSYRSGTRGRNVRRLEAYLDTVESGARPTAGTERLSEWEREKERLFLGVRRRGGVDMGTVGRVFASSIGGQRLIAAGVIRMDDDRLMVVDPLLTDAVAREILATEKPASD